MIQLPRPRSSPSSVKTAASAYGSARERQALTRRGRKAGYRCFHILVHLQLILTSFINVLPPSLRLMTAQGEEKGNPDAGQRPQGVPRPTVSPAAKRSEPGENSHPSTFCPLLRAPALTSPILGALRNFKPPSYAVHQTENTAPPYCRALLSLA